MTAMEHVSAQLNSAVDYRACVDDIVTELRGSARVSADRVHAVVCDVLGMSTSARHLLADGGMGVDLVATRAAAAFARVDSRPAAGAAATASSAVDEVRILLSQQVDLAWWDAAPDFASDPEIAADATMIDMNEWRRQGRLKFNFTLASDKLWPRARNFAVRRWFPDLAPGTPGPSTSLARPEMVRLLNAIAIEFAHRSGPETPPLRLNCLTRSVVDQCRLQDLGFSAHLPSAHCRGWAADLEVAWFARFGAVDALIGVLLAYQNDGLINAIDEGRIWHICPNPATLREWAA